MSPDFFHLYPLEMHKGTEVPLESYLVTRSELPRASLFLRQLKRKRQNLRLNFLLD